MSCVADTLIAGLGRLNLLEKIDPDVWLAHLQANNFPPVRVWVNGYPLTTAELDAGVERIDRLTTLKKGYLCSTADPLLMLVADLYDIEILHRFQTETIRYEVVQPAGTLIVRSDRGHMRLEN